MGFNSGFKGLKDSLFVNRDELHIIIRWYWRWTISKSEVSNIKFYPLFPLPFALLGPDMPHIACVSYNHSQYSKLLAFLKCLLCRALTMKVMLCFFITHCSLRLIVRSELDVPTFATRRLHACHHARAPFGGRWNCGREMFGNFA